MVQLCERGRKRAREGDEQSPTRGGERKEAAGEVLKSAAAPDIRVTYIKIDVRSRPAELVIAAPGRLTWSIIVGFKALGGGRARPRRGFLVFSKIGVE